MVFHVPNALPMDQEFGSVVDQDQCQSIVDWIVDGKFGRGAIQLFDHG